MAFMLPVLAAIGSAAGSVGSGIAGLGSSIGAGLGLGGAGAAGAGAGVAAPLGAAAGGAAAGSAPVATLGASAMTPAMASATGGMSGMGGGMMSSAAPVGAASSMPLASGAGGSSALTGMPWLADKAGGMMSSMGKDVAYPMMTGQQWDPNGSALGQVAGAMGGGGGDPLQGAMGRLKGLMGGNMPPAPPLLQSAMQQGAPTPFQGGGNRQLPGLVQPSGPRKAKKFSDYMMS